MKANRLTLKKVKPLSDEAEEENHEQTTSKRFTKSNVAKVAKHWSTFWNPILYITFMLVYFVYYTS